MPSTICSAAGSSVPFILSDSKLTGASAPGRQPLPCRAPPQAAGIPNPKQLPGHSSAVSAAVSATAIDCCPAQHLRPHCRSLPCAVATKVAQSSYLCTKPNCSTAVSAGPCPRAMQCCPARHWSLHPQPTATVPGSFQTAVSGLVRAASATAALEGQPQRSCKQPVPTQHAQHPSDPAVSGFIAAYSGATAPEGVLLSEVKGKCSDRQKTPLLTELQPSSSTSQQHWNAPAQLAADGTKAALQSAKVPLTQAHPQAGVQDCWAGDSAEQASRYSLHKA